MDTIAVALSHFDDAIALKQRVRDTLAPAVARAAATLTQALA